MKLWNRGNFVTFDGKLAVVVGIEGDCDVPDAHLALWFGDPNAQTPEVWTVPLEYCTAANPAVFWH